eukprot:CAMPEP_0170586486 /NCGR_PEP_ID=MMETSP0224-20130122/9772_1 /TAXON_ID=285029 /ORGANISM="Togula jolla, Strain CCCM 725" /LENGTH=798 /DNA_ID=CAMNT_0010910039 /DNA_START=47 /DNA_END=2440 /DNA_ORIENTATION=+
MAMASPLPREILKWLQSLDLSFTVKNPKRDLCNGFLVAEIVSRYHPKDVNIVGFENATRLAAKVDNWEQLYRFFQKKAMNVSKQDFDPVIHCAPGAAVAFMFKLYNLLTSRTVRAFEPQAGGPPAPAFMRDTASLRLRDTEICRVQDNNERFMRAIDKLNTYHVERRVIKAAEAPFLVRHERRQHVGDREPQVFEEPVQVNEVRVKALAVVDATQRQAPQPRKAVKTQVPAERTQLLDAVAAPSASVGALAGMSPAAPSNAKPVADIMRPLVQNIIQDSEEWSDCIDLGKDVVSAFVEHCREGLAEDTAVRVFETLAQRAQLLVDTMTKSPQEFWKVWATFLPILTDLPEASPVFESAVFFFKRIGELMRETDQALTQQLITEVGLPPLAKPLAKSPEKREALCDIIYSYTPEETLGHLLVLRALKEQLREVPVYACCLACLVTADAQLGLLDEHLLDLYIYYALMALHNTQPKIRVSGISILSTIAGSPQHQSLLPLISHFESLAGDDWWEVQAQLLLVASQLLVKFLEDRQTSAHVTIGLDPQDELEAEDPADNLLAIISRIFVVSASKNVLQVGLVCLANLLAECPALLFTYVQVLLMQPPALRRRLLEPPPADEAGGARPLRLTYVMGSSSHMYEEQCIANRWPHLDVAKTFVHQLDGSAAHDFGLEHAEVFLASLPERLEEADEWFNIFDRVKHHVAVALTDLASHDEAARILQRFWLCSVERLAKRCFEASRQPLVQAFCGLFKGSEPPPREEAAKLRDFIRDLQMRAGYAAQEVTAIVEAFRDGYPKEYAR